LFSPNDDQTPGGHPIVVLSYAFWESQLGSNPGVVSERVVVNGQSMTIIGVAPKGFEGTTLGSAPKFFVPITMRGVLNNGTDQFKNRRSYWAYVFGRLKPGATIEQAQTSLNTVYKPILNDVEAPLQEGMSAATMVKFKAREIKLEEGQRG